MDTCAQKISRVNHLFCLAVFAALISFFMNAPAFGAAPALPQQWVDTTLVPPTGSTITVPAGGDFQAALNSAQPGDVIKLQAGATYTGNFVLPNKAGSGWITIRTDAPDSSLPPPGTRVTPANANVMPKIEAPNDSPAVRTCSYTDSGLPLPCNTGISDGAHHYRFIGIEFRFTPGLPGSPKNYDLIRLGSWFQNSLSQVPHHIIIDRCYIHGNDNEAARRGVALNSAWTAVIDSYVAKFQETGAGDSAAIGGGIGPGPYKIVNNPSTTISKGPGRIS